MKNLTLAVIREYNELFDYCLPEETVREVHKELNSLPGIIREQDIFDELDMAVEKKGENIC